ncbi:MAG: FKBP-type peptidyl-prolyl cis-trans isomerase [Lacunisphaera sp.]|nr:FKBP-type peptidyl-prolyl cis-trans isomerase [Lacunisphaera sp.]
MNRALGLLPIALVLALAGCAPKEPVGSEKTEAELRREEFFGPAAQAQDIAWRPSGLGIRVLKPGEGTAPRPMDRIRLHYTGRLKDGRVFDDTRAKGKPAEFEVSRMIPGLIAGVLALKPGGRAEFFIPPSLGYGGMKFGDIPPVSGLIFDVELLAVNPETPPKS